MSTKRKINDYFFKQEKIIDEPQQCPMKLLKTSTKHASESEYKDQVK